MLHRGTLKDSHQERQLFLHRMIVFCIALSVLVGALLFRLVYLQVFEYQRYTTLSQKNQLNIVPLVPTRGIIYDRNGLLLAENTPVYALEITPEQTHDINKTLKALQKLLPSIKERDIRGFHRSLKRYRSFESVPLKLKLNKEEVARFAVNQYHFPGVSIKARLMRHYPMGESLAHVLGYVGRINQHELQHLDQANYRASNFIGKVGIEKYYEKELHGKVGYQQVETDASGRTIRVIKTTAATSGKQLYLTVDARLQIAAEKAMKGKRGAIVAIEPSSGEVLSMVSVPAYDPNAFVKGISQKNYDALAKSKMQPLYNRAIRGQYPLASTIKPFISLAALNDDIVNLDYKIYDPGWYKLPNADHLYRDWKRIGHGWIAMTRAIVVSCDTYFYQLANLMGIRRIDNILSRFGFGHLTHIDMGEELPGLIPSPEWKVATKNAGWYTGDTLISGIGQGYMLTTPLQLASATAALAGHGRRFRPHLLLKSTDPLSKKTTITKPLEEYPLGIKQAKVWDAIIDAMKQVISSREGTGFRFGRHPAYTIAAKTGTAEVFSAKHHGYEKNADIPLLLRDHSLFIAFAPIEKPKIAIAVIVENSNVASKIARKVMDAYLLNTKKKNP